MSGDRERQEDAAGWAKYGPASGGPASKSTSFRIPEFLKLKRHDLILALIGAVIGLVLYLLLPQELRSGGFGSLFSQLPQAILVGFAIGLLGRIVVMLTIMGGVVLLGVVAIQYILGLTRG